MIIEFDDRTGDQRGEGYYPLITRVLEKVLECEHIAWEAGVSVLFSDPEEIRAMNKRYRAVDAVTDVLSFPLIRKPLRTVKKPRIDQIDPDTGAVLLGDIVICPARAAEQAQQFGHGMEREMGYLAAHGLLHLLGYEHERDEDSRRFMREKEEAALAALGLARE